MGPVGPIVTLRTRWLAGHLAQVETASFLSGMLIGSEFREADQAGWTPTDGRVVIVGSRQLAGHYAQAAASAGLVASTEDADLFVTGALRLARAYEEAHT